MPIEKDSIPAIDSTFPGAMGLKWYCSVEEAKKYFSGKESDLKIKELDDLGSSGITLQMRGKFAGHKLNDCQLYFYEDKFCSATVNFGIVPTAFKEKLKEGISKKYNKSDYNFGKGSEWTFYTENSNDSIKDGQIMLFEDSEEFNLLIVYKSPKSEYLEKIQKEKFNASEKSKIKIENKDI